MFIAAAAYLCTSAITACFNFLGLFEMALPGLFSFILSFFTIYTISRLLLVPLIGQASSDLVTREVNNLVSVRDLRKTRDWKARVNSRRSVKNYDINSHTKIPHIKRR